MSDDTMKALAYIESLLAKADPELFECACKGGEASELLPVDLGELFIVSNTLRAALTPPADDEIGAIRARHDDTERFGISREYSWREECHTDRATLLALVDRLSAELAKERERRVEVEGEALHFRFSKNDHGPLLTFVEAENAEGYSVHVGEWSDDGQYSLLTIPNPYALRANLARLTAALKDIDKCRRYYLQAETPEQRDMRADEFQRFVAGTVSATLTKDTP